MTNIDYQELLSEAESAQRPVDFYRKFEQLNPYLSQLSESEVERLKTTANRMFNMTSAGFNRHDIEVQQQVVDWYHEQSKPKREVRSGFTEMVSGWFGRR